MRSSPFAAALATSLLAAAAASPAAAQELQEMDVDAWASLQDRNGDEVATVRVFDTPNDGLLVWLSFPEGRRPTGLHAFHIHQTGDCSASDFTSAGGHLNPLGYSHGFLAEGGFHAGDMPNVHVPRQGEADVEVMATRVTLNALFDDDGSAFVMHQGPDDYTSQPSGAAGARIACGVIERQPR